MLLEHYKNCIFCGSKKFKKINDQTSKNNFYTHAIIEDLNLTNQFLKKIKTYQCQNCYILQNNPWFSEGISRKIYSNIYGQHNRSWSNLISFLKKGNTPEHGELFKKLNKFIKIKNYAEFNSPFMGIFLNYFLKEFPYNKKLYNSLYKNIIHYLTSRQVAGQTKIDQRKGSIKSKKSLATIRGIKKKNIKKKINKFLVVDNSHLMWGQNDNHKSVNSRSFASELLDLKVLTLNKKTNMKFDLFGIFHTLDHTFNPSKILNFGLNNSKYVVVYCHINEQVEKQHLFSITEKFLKYLKKKKIYSLNLTQIINKKYKSPELYFLCTKNKKLGYKLQNI